MKKLTALGLFGILLLTAAAAVAVWASVADAPWEESSTAQDYKGFDESDIPAGGDSPAFTEEEVLELTGRSIAEQGRFPPDTKWVDCTEADYRPVNRMWVMTCEFRAGKSQWKPDLTAPFTFDDQTGKIGD